MRRTRKRRQRGGHGQHPHLTHGYLSNKKISSVFTNQGRKWLKQHGGQPQARQGNCLTRRIRMTPASPQWKPTDHLLTGDAGGGGRRRRRSRRRRQRGGDGTHPHLAQGFLEAGPQVPVPRSPKDQVGQAPKQPPKGQAPPRRKHTNDSSVDDSKLRGKDVEADEAKDDGDDKKDDQKGGRRRRRRRQRGGFELNEDDGGNPTPHKTSALGGGRRTRRRRRRRRRRTRRRRRRRGRGKNQAQRATSPNSVTKTPRAGNRRSIFKPKTLAAPHHYGKLSDITPKSIVTHKTVYHGPPAASHPRRDRRPVRSHADALIHQHETEYAKAQGCRCAKCNERAAYFGNAVRAPVGNAQQTLSPPPSPPIKVRKSASNKGGKRRRRRTRRKRRRRY